MGGPCLSFFSFFAVCMMCMMSHVVLVVCRAGGTHVVLMACGVPLVSAAIAIADCSWFWFYREP
jgi:hypothetical protein